MYRIRTWHFSNPDHVKVEMEINCKLFDCNMSYYITHNISGYDKSETAINFHTHIKWGSKIRLKYKVYILNLISFQFSESAQLFCRDISSIGRFLLFLKYLYARHIGNKYTVFCSDTKISINFNYIICDPSRENVPKVSKYTFVKNWVESM